MIDLNPALLDQEGIRKKRRKKMLLYAFAPVALLFILSLFFLRPGVFDILFGINYENNTDFAIAVGNTQHFANIIEPYLAYYNTGTAYLQARDGKNAEAELTESLKNNPPADKICQVRVNLSYSIEIQADEAAIKQQYDNALVLYSKAEGVLYEDNCAGRKKSQESKDEHAKQAKERISDKRGEAVSKMNGVSGDNGEDDDSQKTQIQENQIEELRDQLINGGAIRNIVNSGQFGTGIGGGGAGIYNYNNLHW